MTTYTKRVPLEIRLEPHPAAKGSYVARPRTALTRVYDRAHKNEHAKDFYCQILAIGPRFMVVHGEGLSRHQQPCTTFKAASEYARKWAAERYYTLDTTPEISDADTVSLDMWSLGGS